MQIKRDVQMNSSKRNKMFTVFFVQINKKPRDIPLICKRVNL